MISDSSPLSLPPQGVSSLTWTAGESRAVLFLEINLRILMDGKRLSGKPENSRKQFSEIEQY